MRGFMGTILCGAGLTSAFIFGVPPLIEPKARENLIVALPRMIESTGTSVLSGSFQSLSFKNLLQTLIQPNRLSIIFKNPSCHIRLEKLSNRSGGQTFHLAAGEIVLDLDGITSEIPDEDALRNINSNEGVLHSKRITISPSPDSSLEKKLESLQALDFQQAPYVTLAELSTAVPEITTKTRNALDTPIKTVLKGLFGDGSPLPFTATGTISILDPETTIPIFVQNIGGRYRLITDPKSLSDLKLHDPLTQQEIEYLANSPVLFTSVVMVRVGANTISEKILASEASNDELFNKKITDKPSLLALRYITYGYLLRAFFGEQDGLFFSNLFTKDRHSIVSRSESKIDLNARQRAAELLSIGFKMFDQDKVVPNEFERKLKGMFGEVIRFNTVKQK